MPLLLKTGLLSRERSFLSQSCAQAAIPPLLSRVRNRPPRLSPLTFSTKDDQTHGLRYFAQELRVLFHTDAAQSVEQDSKQTYRRTPLDCDVMMTLGNSPQQAVIAFLKTIGIDINLVSYPAHSTVEAGRSLRGDMPGTFTKNLFLKDKKGSLFLVVAEEAWSIDLRTLHAKIGARGRLGFAPPNTVREILGVEPGALTPLALIHDGSRAATVVLDAKIMNDAQLNFHPLVNTQRIGLSPAQLLIFIAATGHQHIVAGLDN
jgi:Ala-tRNA(Pro) deacylase